MKFTPSALTALLGSASLTSVFSADVNPGALDAAITCNKEFGPIIFPYLEDEAVNQAIEDDIRNDLAQLGFEVQGRPLSKADINIARQGGDFHFSLSETWGSPYDPHSFVSGWIDGKGGEGVFPALVNLEGPSSRGELLTMVSNVLQEDDPKLLKSKWEELHKYYHEQAVLYPLYGKRIPTLLSRRLTGYEAGYQQFDYPVHRLKVSSGSKTITIAPGARNGLFHTVGTMNAHVYGPNEFFSNNWVYEGLVAFGANGKVIPSLAIAWDVKSNNIGGDTYTFTLRQGVKFHDGADWNCDVAKLNFDHILAGPLADTKHGWYGVGTNTEDWFCNSEFEFVMRTNKKHEAYLHELTLIRPTRMISPNAFVNGNATDPLESNSCHLDWGVVDGVDAQEKVTCAGIKSISGTGPLKYSSKEEADGLTTRVIFEANKDYWGGAPDFERLEVVQYSTSEQVKAALLDGELDVVWGAGVLPNSDIVEIENDAALSEKIQVGYSAPIQNTILILNTGKPPFDDINVRKTVIHAINKAAFVEKELPGQRVVDNVFPITAPYCDVELTPRWDYDFEKAVLLSCGGTAGNYAKSESAEGGSNALAIGLGVGLGVPCALALIAAIALYNKNKSLKAELNMQGGAEHA